VATEPAPLCGLLNIAKPPGMTSRDVVNRVVGALRERFPKPIKLPKAGHAGTLDPMATGVLVVGVGAGVRLVPYLHQQLKAYEATFRLGQSSVSGDLETPLVDQPDPPRCELAALHAAAKQLTGDVTQTPPAHSAIKIGGRKAYEFAHRGIEIEVPSRVVRIEEIVIERYQYPEIDVNVRCGTGTYIRTLGMDLAALCETTAVMSKLVRTAVGDFSLRDAVALDQLSGDSIDHYLQPLAKGVGHLPRLVLSAAQIGRLASGMKLSVGAATDREICQADEAAVLNGRGTLRVIAQRRGAQWHPLRVFPDI
jgi:tRNA pseudouridine55 synthase